MAEYPSLPLFTDAFIADTTHLTASQTGAYIMLLMSAWRSKNCAIPNNDKILARLARMSDREWGSNKEVILSFWELNADNNLVQKRLIDERKFANDKRNQAVRAGKASALKRKERHSTGVAFPFEPKSNNPTPTPTTTKKEIKIKKKVSLADLSVEHIAEWLTKKRAVGKYLTVDEHALLEKFKNYCQAKGRSYSDYVAAYRNAFEWDNTPKRKNAQNDANYLLQCEIMGVDP